MSFSSPKLMQKWLLQTRMAEAAQAKRGAGLPGVRPRCGVDRRCRQLVGGPMSRSGRPAWRGEGRRDRRRARRCTARSGPNGAATANDAVELHEVIRMQAEECYLSRASKQHPIVILPSAGSKLAAIGQHVVHHFRCSHRFAREWPFTLLRVQIIFLQFILPVSR